MNLEQFTRAISIVAKHHSVQLTINPLDNGFKREGYYVTLHNCTHSVIEELIKDNFLIHLRPHGIEVSTYG
jgi:hypothetical protein